MPAAYRIGPNAIIQVARSLERALGKETADELVAGVGLGGYLAKPPESMVDEREVIALHSAVRRRLKAAAARDVLRSAGLATGDYLLAHRIPKPAQWLMRMMPARFSARALVAAIGRNSWTFAGSGRFAAQAGRTVVITIENNPICRGAASTAPACDYFAATFERLFQRLVDPKAVAVETACTAAGDSLCRFEIDCGGH